VPISRTRRNVRSCARFGDLCCRCSNRRWCPLRRPSLRRVTSRGSFEGIEAAERPQPFPQRRRASRTRKLGRWSLGIRQVPSPPASMQREGSVLAARTATRTDMPLRTPGSGSEHAPVQQGGYQWVPCPYPCTENWRTTTAAHITHRVERYRTPRPIRDPALFSGVRPRAYVRTDRLDLDVSRDPTLIECEIRAQPS